MALAARGNHNLELRRITEGVNSVILRNHLGWYVEVLLNGGQVISWRNERGEELLFVGTREADFSPIRPVAGGISICFPAVSQHGLRDLKDIVRFRLWGIDDSPPALPNCSLDAKSVDLILRNNEDDFRLYHFGFLCRLRVILGHKGDLKLISRIYNTSGASFHFKFSYRNYFRVLNVKEVRVEGLGQSLYHVDENGKHIVDDMDTVTIPYRTDKNFIGTKSKISVIDQQKQQAIIIRKQGLPDAGVFWDPWEDDEIRSEEYVCVEPGRIRTLVDCDTWTGIQELCFVPRTH